MGLITIEVPQRVKKSYRISSRSSGEVVISGVDALVRSTAAAGLKPIKKRAPSKKSGGLWADKNESGTGIAGEPMNNGSNGRSKERDDEYQEAMDAAFGMWSYRNESTDEIAKKLRDTWNGKNGK
jgi:hypothetical protein